MANNGILLELGISKFTDINNSNKINVWVQLDSSITCMDNILDYCFDIYDKISTNNNMGLYDPIIFIYSDNVIILTENKIDANEYNSECIILAIVCLWQMYHPYYNMINGYSFTQTMETSECDSILKKIMYNIKEAKLTFYTRNSD